MIVDQLRSGAIDEPGGAAGEPPSAGDEPGGGAGDGHRTQSISLTQSIELTPKGEQDKPVEY